MKEDKTCALCSDVTDSTLGNEGKANCKTCTKTGSDNPTCSACLDGYFFDSGTSTCTDKCGDNCATCSVAGDPNKCETCKTGYFLVTTTDQQGKKCVPCDSVDDKGREGCSVCSNNGAFKCTDCKPNYRKEGSTGSVTCTKICEDDTACGGTSGACDAIVIDDKGVEHHYCSYCGEANTYPIDGKCNSAKANNQCDQGVCTQCTNNYFLYMGGCYKVDTVPGQHMCKTAANGVCTAVNANNRYFIVPGATNQNQSVLACENPLGTLVGTGDTSKAYVGVDGCSACTAPAAPSETGMTAAVCTACTNNNKPNLAGSGCFACTVDGCSHCGAGDKCEACTSKDQRPNTDGTKCIACNIDGCVRCSEENKCGQCGDDYRLEGEACVSTKPSGGNRSGLSTGAIAGISVAVIAVVGGLVGFLCWWFVCRGKA
eukprot:XP_001705784.1 VSP [Giardia lamblia ATCC 50803]